MKQIVIILLSIAAGVSLAPHSAQAATNQPTYTWHGPGCNYDNSNWAVCSIDPPPSDQNIAGPCYVSRDPDYMPNAFDRAAVSLCQAAKTMLDASPSDRTKAANLVTAMDNKFVIITNENPQLAFVDIPASGVHNDFANFNADMMIYNASPSAQTWQLVVNDLISLAADGSIIGGP